MMQHGRVRVVNETTSLGMMLNAYSPTYSPSNVQKAAGTTKPYDRRGHNPVKTARFLPHTESYIETLAGTTNSREQNPT
jgi:hypothetical protein